MHGRLGVWVKIYYKIKGRLSYFANGKISLSPKDKNRILLYIRRYTVLALINNGYQLWLKCYVEYAYLLHILVLPKDKNRILLYIRF